MAADPSAAHLPLEGEDYADGKRLRRDREHQARRVFERLHGYFPSAKPLYCAVQRS